VKERPNIIVFMTDQQNADTIKKEHQAITPNIEAFCEKAVVFEEAFCVSPHCCPSRASFFSGLYPSQHGVWNNVEIDNALSRGLYDGVELFPEVLCRAGYRTYFSGKWHVSAYEGPKDRGFEHVLNEYVSNYGRFRPENRPRSNDWERVYQSVQNIDLSGKKEGFGQISREGYPIYYQFGEDQDPFGDRITVQKACDVIRDYDKADPFFMYVGVTGPHDPYCPPKEYIQLYEGVDMKLPESFDDPMEDKPALYRRTRRRFDLTLEEEKESMRRYLAFVSFEDAMFGRLLQAVEEKGIFQDTYIIYLTDHGDYLGAHGLWAKGLPCFREAYHICAAIGGGGMLGHKSVKELVSITDFAPTILELAGVKEALPTAGRSLCPFLNEEIPGEWRREIYTQTNGNELYGIQRAVWDQKWKYVFNGFDEDELYDLEQDPWELHNVINEKEHQGIVKSMCRKMWQFARTTKDACTCPYIMVSLAPYGPGIIWEDGEPKAEKSRERQVQEK